MGDWGKELFKEWMDKKLIPDLEELVKEATGYKGGFNRHEIGIEKPRIESNSPWDVYFHSLQYISHALHHVYSLQERKIHPLDIHMEAVYLFDGYFQKNYPIFYRKNEVVIREIKNPRTYMELD